MASANFAAERVSSRARRRRIDWLPYLMVAPTVIVLTVFSIAPTLYGALVSLYNVQFVQLLAFVGQDGWQRLLRPLVGR